MNKKLRTFLSASLVAVVLCAMPACDWFKRFRGNTAETENNQLSFYLLDANDADLYKSAHIPGARHVTLESIDDLSKGWNKNASIVVYCSPACGTKELVAKKLKEAGFKDVKIYVGGITEWRKLSNENKAAYPLEGEAQHVIFTQPEVPASMQTESTESQITADQLRSRLEDARK